MTVTSSGTITSETLLRMVWVSTILAMIFVLPPLGLFYIVFAASENLIAGIIAGFALHFVALGLSPKISARLTSWLCETKPLEGKTE